MDLEEVAAEVEDLVVQEAREDLAEPEDLAAQEDLVVLEEPEDLVEQVELVALEAELVVLEELVVLVVKMLKEPKVLGHWVQGHVFHICSVGVLFCHP